MLPDLASISYNKLFPCELAKWPIKGSGWPCCASSAPFQRCRCENQRIPLVALWAFEGPIFEAFIGLVTLTSPI